MKSEQQLQTRIKNLFQHELDNSQQILKKQLACCNEILTQPHYTSPQSTVYLCNFVKRMCLKHFLDGQLISLTGLVCQCISKCIVAQSQVDYSEAIQQVPTAFQIIMAYVKQTNCSSGYVALYDLLKLGKSIPQGSLKELKKLVARGLVDKEENISLICACLLPEVCDSDGTSKYHQETMKRLLSSIQSLLNLCYCLVEGSSLVNVIKLEKADPILKREQEFSVSEYLRLFRAMSTGLQRCLTRGYSFIIQLDVDSIVEMMIRALALDSSMQVYKTIYNC